MMINYNKFRNKLLSYGMSPDFINVVMEELREGIDLSLEVKSLDVEIGNVKLKSPYMNSEIPTTSDFSIEINGKPIDIGFNILKIKIPEFDVRSTEITAIDLTIYPFEIPNIYKMGGGG